VVCVTVRMVLIISGGGVWMSRDVIKSWEMTTSDEQIEWRCHDGKRRKS
jgi:hypothetical protein